MKLSADKSFSGVHGCAGKGQVIEVDDALGRLMLAEGYPVTEVVADGARKQARKPEGDPDSR